MCSGIREHMDKLQLVIGPHQRGLPNRRQSRPNRFRIIGVHLLDGRHDGAHVCAPDLGPGLRQVRPPELFLELLGTLEAALRHGCHVGSQGRKPIHCSRNILVLEHEVDLIGQRRELLIFDLLLASRRALRSAAVFLRSTPLMSVSAAR
jgi:hypothetical protein